MDPDFTGLWKKYLGKPLSVAVTILGGKINGKCRLRRVASEK
jgi:hypothetical protein